ncbi:MAG TPA: pilin [Rhodanobacteraceae bacterium]|nr:pilin [Rhodanobacteraceae bacterium]
MKTLQKGFTLIELMIVVAIIAILAAIAIPAYQDYVIRSQVSEGASLADGAKTAVAEFWSNNGKLPASNASAGLAGAASIEGKYVSSVNVASGAIVVTYSNANSGGMQHVANSAINGLRLTFSPVTGGSAGSIAWHCSPNTGAATPTNIPVKYLPASCRYKNQ